MEKQDKYVYPAVFDYAEDGISISFPDLPGCFSCADNDAEALRMAKDALSGYMWTLEDFDDPIPNPTPFIEIQTEPNQRVQLIEVYMPLVRDAISAQSVKKTLTIPAWMNEAAEKEGINFSQLLQASIKRVLKAASL